MKIDEWKDTSVDKNQCGVGQQVIILLIYNHLNDDCRLCEFTNFKNVLESS